MQDILATTCQRDDQPQDLGRVSGRLVGLLRACCVIGTRLIKIGYDCTLVSTPWSVHVHTYAMYVFI